MRTRIKKTIGYLRQKGIVLGSILGFAVGIFSTGAVYAAIPDGNGIIHACRSNLLATIRIIDSASDSCNGTETLMNWNSVSPGQFVSNLVGADFTNTSLSYRHLAGQDIHGATFTSAVLNGANLTGANLSASTMAPTNTTLLARNTNFTNANLNNIEIAGTIDLAGANLSGMTMNNSTFTADSITLGGNFSSANLTNARLLGRFESTNFSNVDFRDLQEYNATFVYSDLADTLFNGMNLGTSTQFHSGLLTNADFTGATVSSFFQGTSMSGANFTDVDFVNADLQSTDFSGAIFTNATWSNTWCPDSTNSNSNGGTCIGHLTP